MLPSARLILMVAGAAPIFLAGALYEPAAAIGVLYVLLLGVYAAIDALLLPRRRHITVRRDVPRRISLGVPTCISFEIHNSTRREVQISLAENLPELVEADPPVSSALLSPGARGTVEYRLLARRRGRYTLLHTDVRILPRAGLFYRQFRLDLPDEFDVFPNLVNVERYELLLRRGLLHEHGLGRLRQIGQGSEFESLRHHSAGDDMSRVDWKATAKRARLIVRNYQPERRQSVLVAIDVGRATAGEFAGVSRLDYLVNATLMLAYVALRQGDWFSLTAFSDRIESYLPPVRRVQSLDRVARALYRLQPRLVEADYAAACRFLGLKHRKRSLVCLMTDVIDREASAVVIDYLAQFAKYHLPLVVALANPEIRELAELPLAASRDPYAKAVALDVSQARRQALMQMRRLGVSVLDIEPTALTAGLINRYLAIKAARRL